MIETLPLLKPDPARSARTLARCRVKVARRAERAAMAKPRPNPALLAFERLVVAGLVLAYLASVLDIAISIPPVG